MPRPNHSIFPDQSRECWTRLRHYAGPLQGQKLVVPPAGAKNNASHKRHTHNPRHADRRSRRRLRERSKTFSELPLTGRVSTESRRQRILGGLHATSRFRQGCPRSVLSWPALRRSDTRIRSQTREARRTSIAPQQALEVGCAERPRRLRRGRSLGHDLGRRGRNIGRNLVHRGRILGHNLGRRGRSLAHNIVRRGHSLGHDLGRRGSNLGHDLIRRRRCLGPDARQRARALARAVPPRRLARKLTPREIRRSSCICICIICISLSTCHVCEIKGFVKHASMHDQRFPTLETDYSFSQSVFLAYQDMP